MSPQAHPPSSLLAADEPLAWTLLGEHARSDIFLSCDHAGQRIPRALGSLGLQAEDLARHIAWDIGAAALTAQLAQRLNACAILQPYSRLVIDCNRPLRSPESIAENSERTRIPGNQALSAPDIAARQREIFEPYHGQMRALLDQRHARGQRTIFIAMHSFTPVFMEQRRPWHVGLLYQRDARVAQMLGELLRAEPGLVVGDNQPYALEYEADYSVPEHAERRGLPHLELEIRQDLIADEAGQTQWAERLARLLHRLEPKLAML